MFYKSHLIQTEPPTQQAPCSGDEDFWLTNSGPRFSKIQEWVEPDGRCRACRHDRNHPIPKLASTAQVGAADFRTVTESRRTVGQEDTAGFQHVAK